MSENFSIHFAKLSSFQGRPKMAVPFVTGNFGNSNRHFGLKSESALYDLSKPPLHVLHSLHSTPTLLQVMVL